MVNNSNIRLDDKLCIILVVVIIEKLVISVLNQKIEERFRNEPFLNELLNILVKQKNK